MCCMSCAVLQSLNVKIPSSSNPAPRSLLSPDQVGEQIVGYKKVPLSEAVEKLSKA